MQLSGKLVAMNLDLSWIYNRPLDIMIQRTVSNQGKKLFGLNFFYIIIRCPSDVRNVLDIRNVVIKAMALCVILIVISGINDHKNAYLEH